jgi:hypothetical protein
MAQAINNTIKDVVMPSPNAASLGKYGDIPVSYHTGVPNVGIPIHTLQEGSVSLPVSLSYHAGGVKVGEPASWVGLGWSLQAGGMISRTVQGRPDESSYGYLTTNQELNTNGLITYGSASVSTISRIDLATGLKDGEPDIFSFSVGGYSGKFFFGLNDSVVVVPKQDVSIQYVFSGVNQLTKFTIRTPDGNIFEFGDIGDGTPAIETTLSKSGTYFSFWTASGWYLKKITSADLTARINLSYAAEEYRLYSVPSSGVKPNKVINSDVIPPKSLYQPNNYSDMRSWRLSAITTTTETVTFIPGTANRQDVTNTVVGSEAKVLNTIQINNGTYCKNFILTQSYFQDNDPLYNTDGKDADFRLKLESVQEKSCDNSVTQPAYTFNYYGQTGNVNYLPNRYSKAIDHWGYYNGAQENARFGINIPFTRLRYTLINTSVPNLIIDVSNGGSNRETNEELLKWGTLRQITYPTGGNTAFEFEANTYWDLSGQKELVKVDSLKRYWPSGQCFTDATPVSSAVVSKTFSADDLENMFYEGRLLKSNANAGSICSNSYYANISVYVGNSTTPIYWAGGSSAPVGNSSDGGLNKLIYLFPFLQANVQYRFEILATNAAVRFDFIKEVTVNAQFNRKVGGLRVKKVTTHDGLSTSNDVVKTYDYSNSGDATKSSGVLYSKPVYGGIYEGNVACNTSNCSAGGLYATQRGYILPLFSDYSIAPLGSFEGKTVGYSFVKERNSNQTYTEYLYFQEQVNGYQNIGNTFDSFDGSPTLPSQPCIDAGNMMAQYQVSATGQFVASTTNTILTNDVYEDGTGTCYKARELPIFSSPNADYFISSSYKIRNKPYRLSSVVSTVDNITSSTNYTYGSSNSFYAPTEVSTTNSDGKVVKTKTYYAQNLPSGHPNQTVVGTSGVSGRDVLIRRFMIGIPLQTEQFVNNVQVGGSILEYTFSGTLTTANSTYATAVGFPTRAYSLNKDLSAKLNITVNAYDRGMPQSMTKAGYALPQTYSWDTYRRFNRLSWHIEFGEPNNGRKRL